MLGLLRISSVLSVLPPSFQSPGIPIGQTQLEAERTGESIKEIHRSQHMGEESKVEGVKSRSGG